MPSPQQARLAASVAAAKERVARAQANLARRRSRLAAANRKADTRRKILAGAWVLAQAGRSQKAKDKLRKGLDSYLKADRDRALFDLPPREVSDG